MLTTLVPLALVQEGSGAILTMTEFTGSAQTVYGPVQKEDSFLGIPPFVTGVKSHTLAPAWKLRLSWWYCLLCLLTASAKFFLTNPCAVSMRFRR
jgi:hypothetical protein